MAACRQVYDSRHLQADCQEPGTLLSVIEYGLPLHFLRVSFKPKLSHKVGERGVFVDLLLAGILPRAER